MRAPQPSVVILVLFAVALFNLVNASIPSGPRGFGYIVGTLLVPTLLSALYVWWFRRRARPGS